MSKKMSLALALSALSVSSIDLSTPRFKANNKHRKSTIEKEERRDRTKKKKLAKKQRARK